MSRVLLDTDILSEIIKGKNVAVIDERAALAKELLLSLDGSAEAGPEEAWAEEGGRRAQAVADGTATLVDWADAEQRIAARLKARREAGTTR
jgi:predicted nucleic acid-binding protein